jgi:hypothetical protein
MATRLGEKRPSVCWNVDGNKRKMLGSDVCFLQSVDILGTNETELLQGNDTLFVVEAEAGDEAEAYIQY